MPISTGRSFNKEFLMKAFLLFTLLISSVAKAGTITFYDKIISNSFFPIMYLIIAFLVILLIALFMEKFSVNIEKDTKDSKLETKMLEEKLATKKQEIINTMRQMPANDLKDLIDKSLAIKKEQEEYEKETLHTKECDKLLESY